jgi:iron complex transport system substrate-binding protein
MRLIALLLTLCAATPQRIVSTAPSITETLFAMGLGPHVVGVTIYCKYPEAALKIAKIGTYLKPDVEAIVALHPDLVVVQKQSNNLAQELARLHIPCVEVESHNLDNVYAGARAIGKAANATEAADHFVNTTQSQLQAIKTRTASLPKPTVAFIVGHTGGRLEGLVAGAATSYFSDILTTAGGINVFTGTSTPYPHISLEEILSRNPDYILEMSGESQAKQDEVIALWKQHPTLKAVAAGHIYAIPPGPFLIPGPRAVEAANIMFHLLHP